MKRKVLGLFAGIVLVGGGVVSLQAGPATADTTLNLRLKESFCGADRSYCKRLDHNPLGSFGDSLVFSLPLEYRSDGRRAGRDEGECVTLAKDSGHAYCTFVAHLRNGTVAVQGSIALSDTDVSILPITGGTGAYQGASGYWKQVGQKVVLHTESP